MAKHISAILDTPFQRRMSEGHYNRVGHQLLGVLVSDDGSIWQTVRLCCGETVPETVEAE
jgi:hypothetical protein